MKVGNLETEMRSWPISRVLSWTAIPLGRGLLHGSSHLPASSAGRVIARLFGVAPGRGCRVSPLDVGQGGVSAASMAHQDSSLWPCSSPSATRTLLPRGSKTAASRRTGVTRYRTLWSPDFPLPMSPRVNAGLPSMCSGCLASFICILPARSRMVPSPSRQV